MRLNTFLNSVSTLLLAAATLSGQSIYWDINGVTANSSDSTSADGTWDAATTANWSPSSDGTAATSLWTSGATAIFSAGNNATGSSTVTVAGTINVAKVQTEEGSVSLQGGELANLAEIETNAGTSLTISGVVSGTQQLTKTGTGNLTLAGDNTYSGGTAISGGIVNVSSNSNLGAASGGVSITNGGVLASTGSLFSNRAITVDGAGSQITNNGELVIGDTAAGSLALTNGAHVSGFNIRVGYQTAALSTLSVSSGSSVNASGTFFVGDTGGTNGSVTIQGSNSIINLGTNSFLIGHNGTGTTSISDGGWLRASVSLGAVSGGSGTLNLNTGGVLETSSIAIGTGSGTFNFAGGELRAGNSFSSSIPATLSNASTVNTAGYDVTLSGTFSGTGSLTKQGTGTLTLGGTNSYTGATSITGGSLSIAADAALGTAPGSATPNHLSFDGGTLATTASFAIDANRGIALGAAGGTFDTASDTILSYGGIIAGEGALNKSGSGNLALSGTNTYTGGTTISAGTLTIGAGDGSGWIPGDITNQSTLVYDRTGDMIFGGVISGTGSFTQNRGILRFSQAQTYTGPTTINSGAILVLPTGVDQGLSTSTTVEVASGGILDFSNRTLTIAGLSGAGNIYSFGGSNGHLIINLPTAQSSVFSGVLGSNGLPAFALTKAGEGTFTLSGTNLYTGGTTLTGGTLSINADAALGAVPGAATPNNLSFDGGTLATTETFTLNANRGIALGASGGIFNTATDTTLTYGGIMAGTGSLTKTGAGDLTLSGANTFSGTTTISGGTLNLGHSDALQQSTLTTVTGLNPGTLTTLALGNLSGSGTFDLTNSESITRIDLNVGGNNTDATFSGTLTGEGSLTKTGTGTLTLTGSNSFLGGTIISAGSLRGNTSSLQGNITNNANLTFDQATNATFDTDISGSGSFTKTGAGNLTLSGSNTYTGATQINAGTLTRGTETALGSTAAIDIASGATLDLGGYDLTIGDLDGAGNINLGSNTLTTGDASDHTLSGTISGASGQLIKEGSGNLTLSGNNTYSGATSINAGTLTLGSTTALAGTSSVDIALGSTLNLNGNSVAIADLDGAGAINLGSAILTTGDSADHELSGLISGTGGLTKQGTGNLTVSGDNTFSGATNINAGTLILGSTTALGNTSSLTLASDTLLDLNNNSATIANLNGAGSIALGSATLTTGDASNHAFSGTISGTGGLTKQGDGTLTLSGSNEYSGATAINAGTLTLGSTSALGDTASVDVASGATLNLNNNSFTIADLDGAGNISLGSATLTTGDTNNHSLSGTISGTGGLTKTGSGNLTLSGTNSYEGATALQEGTLILGSDAALAATSSVDLDSGTTLDINDFSVTVANLDGEGNIDLGSGTLTTGDASNHELAGTISGTGGLTKQGSGNLTLSGDNSFSGETIISAGTLTLGSSTAVSDSVEVASGATLDLNDLSATIADLDGDGNIDLGSATLTTGNNNNHALSGLISGTGGLTKQGSGNLTLSGDNSFSGETIISAGTLTLGSSTAVSDSVEVASGATLDLNNNSATIADLDGAGNISLGNATLTTGTVNNHSLSGVISGSGNLIKQGSGQLTLSNTNTFTGATTVNAGTLSIATDDALGTAPETATSDHLTLNSGTLATTATVTLDANRGLTLGASGGTFDTATDTTLTYGGILAGDGSLTKTGTGSLILSGTNTFTGATSVNSGTLSIAADAALGTAPVSAASDHLILNSGTLATTATFSLDANRGLTLGASGGTFNTDTDTTLTYGGILAGSGSLAKSGSGSLILSGNNTFTGATSVNSGTLSIAADAALGTAPVSAASDHLTLNSGTLATTATFSLDANRGLTLGASGGTFDTASATTLTYGGILAGTGNLTKTGSGILVLTGANTYSGDTFLNAGTLRVNTGSLPGAVTNNAALVFDQNSDDSFSSVISGTGSLTKEGSGNLTLAAANTFTGPTSVSAGTLTLGNADALQNSTLNYTGNFSFGGLTAATLGGLSGSADLALANASSAAVNLSVGNNNTTFSGILSGGGRLIKTGSGDFTLSGVNTFTGGTEIDSGRLILGHANALAQSTVQLDAAFNGLRFGSLEAATIGGLTGFGSFSLTNESNAPVTLSIGANNASTTFNGAFAGSGSLIKVGSGNLTLAGSSDFSGTVTIAEGTLTLQNTSALLYNTITGVSNLRFGTNDAYNIGTLSGSGNLTLENANSNPVELTLQSSTSPTTFSGVLSGPGSIRISGADITLTQDQTYTGQTRLVSGRLTLETSTILQNSTLNYGGGTLDIGELTTATFGGLTGTGTLDIPSGVTFNFGANNADTTFEGGFSGSGNLTKTGAGSLTLSNSSGSIAGEARVNQGTIVIAHHDALSSATLPDVTGFRFSDNLSNNSVRVGRILGTGTLALETLNGSPLTLVLFGDSQNATFSGNLTGPGNLEIDTSSTTVTLDSPNSFTGQAILSSGTLLLADAEALRYATANLDGMGTLSFGNLTAATFGGLYGSGSLDLTNATSNPVALTVDLANANATFSGYLTGEGSFTKSGLYNLTLDSGSSFSVPVTIDGGQITLESESVLSGSIVTVGSSGILDLGSSSRILGGLAGSGEIYGTSLDIQDNAAASTFTGTFRDEIDIRKTGESTFTFNGSFNNYGNSLRLEDGTFVIGANAASALEQVLVTMDGGSLSFGTLTSVRIGSVDGNGNLALMNANNQAVALTLADNRNAEFSGILSGTGSLILEADITLSGANTFTGSTTVDSGTLTVANQDALQNSTLNLSSSGYIEFTNASTFDLGGLAGEGYLPSGSYDLNIGSNNANTSFSGNLYDNFNITKRGSGNFTLGGSSDYRGTLTLAAGTVTLGSSDILRRATVHLPGGEDGNGQLSFGTSSSADIGGLTGSGDLALTNTNNEAVDLTLNADYEDTTFDGVLSGSGSLTKEGSRVFTLTKAQTFTGLTTIDSGTLVLDSGASLAGDLRFYYGYLTLRNPNGLASSTVTLNTSTSNPITFEVSDTITFGGLAGSSDFTLPSSYPLAVGANDENTSFSGRIWGNGTFIKTGQGTFTFGGSIAESSAIFQLDEGTFRTSSSDNLSDNIVNLNGGTLSFGTNTNYTLGGLSGSNSLTLANDSSNPVNLTIYADRNDSTFEGQLAGSGSLTKSGSRTFTLTNDQTFTGQTTIESGTLRLDSGSSLTGPTRLSSGGTLELVDSQALIASTVNFDGGNLSYLSGSDITLGGLAGSGQLSFPSGYSLLVGNNGENTIFSGRFSSDGTLVKIGEGTLTFSGSNSGYNATIQLSEGAFQLSSSSDLYSSTVQLDGGDLTFGSTTSVSIGGLTGSNGLLLQNNSSQPVNLTIGQNGNDSIFEGEISGTGSLTKEGSGTFTLRSANTFTGQTNISDGNLRIEHSEALQSSTVNYSGSGNLVFDSNLTEATFGALTGSRNIALANENGDPLNLIVGGNDETTTFSAYFTGPGSLTKTGSGTFTIGDFFLPGSAYTGATTIEEGTLRVSDTDAITDTSGIEILSAGTLDLNSQSIILPNLEGSGNISLGSGTLTTGSDQNRTFSGVISGEGGLTKQGSGTFTLAGTNTYTGATNVNAGTLQIGSAAALATTTSVDVASDATLDLNNNSVTLPDLDGSGAITLGSATLTTGDANAHALTGVISGTGSLIKQGSGNLNLAGNNTFTGSTTINAGTLEIAASTALGAPPEAFSVAHLTLDGGTLATTATFALNANRGIALGSAGGTFNTATATNLTYGGIIAGTGSLAKSGAGDLTLSGDNTYTGTTTINEGTIILTNPNALQQSTLTTATGLNIGSLSALTLGNLSGSGTLELTNSGSAAIALNVGGNNSNATFSGTLTGVGSLTKSGSGILTLEGENTYTGSTTVNAGTLQLGSTSALGTTASVIVASGTTLDLNNNSVTIADLDGSGNISLGSGTLTTGSDQNRTFSGVISGTGGLTVNQGSFTLSGENTYTGTTTVNEAASLRLQGPLAATSNADPFSTSEQIYLQFESGSTTQRGYPSSQIINNGTLALTGTGYLVLDNPITGAGTFQVAGESLVELVDLDGENNSLGAVTIESSASLAVLADTSMASLVINNGLFNPVDSLTAISGSVSLGGKDSVGRGIISVFAFEGSTPQLTIGGDLTNHGSARFSMDGGQVTIDGDLIFDGDMDEASIIIGDTSARPSSATIGGNLVLNGGTMVALVGEGSSLQVDGQIQLGMGDGTHGELFIGGTLEVGGSNGIQTGLDETSVWLEAGTLRVIGSDLTTSAELGLSYSPQAGTGTIDTNGFNASLSGNISGIGSLTKSGSGTLTVAGENTYTGGTFVNQGTLQIAGSGQLTQTAALEVNNGSLQLDSGSRIDSGSAVFTGTSNLTSDTSTLNITGNMTLATSADDHVTVVAHNSPLTTTGNLTIGQNGRADLTLNAGEQRIGGSLILAQNSGSTANLNLNGATLNFNGSTPATLSKGEGTATLNLDNGAIWTVQDLMATLDAAIAASSNATLNAQSNATLTWSGVLSGTGSIQTTGAGTVSLQAANTYSGGTSITGGTLVVANSTGSALGTGNVSVANGGTLSGSGSFSGDLSIAPGGSLAPGSSPGTLTVGNTTLAGSADNTTGMIWEINNATGSAGSNWDLLAINGTLTVNATAASPFVIALHSLDATNAPGLAQNFDPLANQSFTFVTTTGGVLFGADASVLDSFTIDATAFQNEAPGSWSISLSGNDLTLLYAIPEPRLYALLLGLAALALAHQRRRRKI